MNAIVDKALSLWDLSNAHYTLVAARENAVYKVETPTDIFALRLHRQEYRTNDELGSELHWMKAIGDGGLSIPCPVPSKTGHLMHVVDGVQVDVLKWLTGDTLDTVLRMSNAKTRVALFQTLGRDMARLHNICDAWLPPHGFTRCAWDVDGLLGETPLWGRFWDNPGLTFEDRDLLKTFRQKARADLIDQSKGLDYGLIHADLVAANVMASGTALHFIDFDDGGYGYRVFELATALLKHIDAPDFPSLKQAMIEGYISIRPIVLGSIDLFMALRATTYVGWNITRLDEDGGRARNARFIVTATNLAADYIG